MAKQKCDNKTVDIQLLILRDKVEELIDDYEDHLFSCYDIVGQCLYTEIVKDLEKVVGELNGFRVYQGLQAQTK